MKDSKWDFPFSNNYFGSGDIKLKKIVNYAN